MRNKVVLAVSASLICGVTFQGLNSVLYAGNGEAVPTSTTEVRMLTQKEIAEIKPINLATPPSVVKAMREEAEKKASRGEEEAMLKIISIYNKYLGNAGLKGTGEIFYKQGKEHGLSSTMMVAIAIHETTYGGLPGNSPVCKNNFNVAGINWVKGCNYEKAGWYIKYPSIEEGIHDFARRLKKYYIDQGLKTIDKIGNKWCPTDDPRQGIGGMDNHCWIPNVTRLYNNMKGEM